MSNYLTRTLLDIAATANAPYMPSHRQDARDQLALDDWIAEEFGIQGHPNPAKELITEASKEFCEHEDELNDFLDNVMTPRCEELRSNIVGRYIQFEMEAFN